MFIYNKHIHMYTYTYAICVYIYIFSISKWTQTEKIYTFMFFYSFKNMCVGFRKRRREKERERKTSMWERNIDWLPPICTLTRDWTRHLGLHLCLAQESNFQPLGVPATLQPTEPHWPELFNLFQFKLVSTIDSIL